MVIVMFDIVGNYGTEHALRTTLDGSSRGKIIYVDKRIILGLRQGVILYIDSVKASHNLSACAIAIGEHRSMRKSCRMSASIPPQTLYQNQITAARLPEIH